MNAYDGGRGKIDLSISPLPRTFYDRDTVCVSHEILGKILVHVVDGIPLMGRIVEVESYLGIEDKASHSSRGLTPRTRVMFGPPGHAYIYMIYGMYYCMNVVTEKVGNPCAILIRALEPLRNITKNTKGPGLLCRAMALDRTKNGADLVNGDFYVGEDPDLSASFSIVSQPRIGVHYAGDWKDRLLRFYIEGNPYISKS